MKLNIKRLTALTAIGVSMGLAVGVSAFAHPMDGDNPAWGGQQFEQHRAQMAKFHEKRLAALKAKLKLTANQEAAWQTFAQSHQPPADAMPARMDREALAKLRTPQRLDEMQKQMDAHDATMQKHRKQMMDATREFYGQLSAEQQKVFDAETVAPALGKHGHGHDTDTKRGPAEAPHRN